MNRNHRPNPCYKRCCWSARPTLGTTMLAPFGRPKIRLPDHDENLGMTTMVFLGNLINILYPPGCLCLSSGASEKPGGDAARVGYSTRRRVSEDVTLRTRGVPPMRATATRRYKREMEVVTIFNLAVGFANHLAGWDGAGLDISGEIASRGGSKTHRPVDNAPDPANSTRRNSGTGGRKPVKNRYRPPFANPQRTASRMIAVHRLDTMTYYWAKNCRNPAIPFRPCQ